MPRPENGIYIIQGEVNLLVTAMRRNSRWSSHTHQDDDQDPLLNSFSQLKELLNTVPDLDDLAPNEFLSPFLDVIRSEDTTGPITGLALTSVNKFLSYGLIDSCCETAAAAIENIADAVTHARFVGTDPGSDEVVLMKILHVLRTLMLTPAGAKLTNESVCEIMQSCFRICFEMRLSELLRKSAEHTLMDMVQLLFSRLPQFKEDPKWATSLKKLKMRTGSMDPSRAGKKKKSPKPKHKKVSQGQQQTTTSSNTQEVLSPSTLEADPRQPATEETSTNTNTTTATSTGPAMPPESIPTPPNSNMTSPDVEQVLGESETIATTPVAGGITVVDIHESFRETSDTEKDQEQTGQTPMVPPCGEEQQQLADQEVDPQQGDLDQIPADVTDTNSMLAVPGEGMKKSGSETELNSEADRSSYTSEVGDDVDSVQSMAEQSDAASVQEADYVNPRGVRFTAHQQNKEGAGPLIPYGLPCVRELFRFLISLTNPIDRHNTDVMIHMGLSLLTAALESGADNIASFNSLLCLLRDDMCKNLFFLLQSERLSLFAASVRVCFLLFESTRSHLKFQLEMYLTKLMDIIVSESPRILYEQREIALESVVQLCRIPGLVTELYLNYDCDLYCSNLFEDLTKLLSKNAFPVSGLFNTHLLSLDALLAVIDSIEQHCHHRVLNSTRPVTETDSKAPAITLSEELAKQSGEGKSETGSLSDGSLDASVPPPPPMSGYAMADRMGWLRDVDTDSSKAKGKDARRTPQIRPNRMKISTKVPTEEELIAIKHKKKVYQTGTEQFNVKPTKGIAFLQDQGLLSAPLDPGEVVTFLKENPKLDKKQIGEYLSNKKNGQVLEAYQKSFAFEDTRVDEALRMYLESFRLPGEAPVISYLLEHFADHWHKYNGEPFANADAAFTLSYAVIMLNVDQHNHNAKKQNIPMTAAEFKRNLSKVNGGQDFDEDMLDEVYNAVRNDEIVMPAEQTGLVRENYLWKVLLRRGGQKEGQFTHAPTGAFDRDLFSLVWGPTVAALSFVFDKSLDETIIQKAISGFRKCAMISAHYGLSDVFDNLVISLCKFTTLLSSAESPENIPIVFGNNMKAQLAARTVFNLAHRHGDILREGWKNILDCMLQLYRAKLLPEVLVKVEDFVDPSGRISLVKEDNTATQRAETGVLSSFYSYFTLAEPVQQRGPSAEEQESIKQAHKCIQDCHVEQLITESKFLRMDSLQELIKALIFASRYPEVQETMNGTQCDEEAAVLNLELLIRVVLQNRDRVGPFWQNVRDHLCNLIVNANEATLLVERAVVGLLRISIRLLRREEIAAQVLTSLRILLMMKPNVIHAVCRQVSFALHDLLRTNAANIHSSQDWYTLFTLLEVVGAGTNPPPILQVGAGVRDVQESISDAGAQSDSELSSSANTEAGERGYTSDSELYEVHKDPSYRQNTEPVDIKPIPSHGSWLLVNREDLENGKKPQPVNQYNIVLNEELRHHDTKSLMKSCETLAFLVRDAAHVTPHNFESCVHCIRTFVEASIHGGRQHKTQSRPPPKDKRSLRHRRKEETRMKKSKSSPSHLAHHLQDSDEEVETDGYHSLSIQLLDLMHTLHTRAATIFSSWAEEERHNREPVEPYLEGTIDAQAGTLWLKCWSPLLQGIARLCCDTRRIVRSQALTYLQRALLVHDLQTLSAVEWESCFNKVLFPLLHKLLDNINVQDPGGIEETRMRASTLLCKVFLQHLSPLLSLSTFTALWLTILEFMDKYMHADKSDLLCEAIPESLKNMLLVMHTAGILQTGEAEESQLWKLTWDRIDTFLPTLRVEVFKPHELEPRGPVMRDSGTSADTQPSPAQPPPTQSAPSPPRQTQSPARVSTPVQEQPVRATQPDANDAPKNGEVGRCGSPLNAPDHVPKTGPYILHTPLPSVTGPSKDSSLTSVPILLNPDIMQSTTVPFISPQGTPERKAEVVSEGP